MCQRLSIQTSWHPQTSSTGGVASWQIRSGVRARSGAECAGGASSRRSLVRPLLCTQLCLWMVMVWGAVSVNAGEVQAAKGFEVHGQVTWEILAVNPKIWTFSYLARVAGQTWEIRVKPASATTAKALNFDEYLATSDGSTLYLLTDFGTDIRLRAARGEDVGANTYEALVYTNVVPNDKAFVSPIWLAFCSGSYFQGLGTNRITVPICENVFSGNSINGLVALEYTQPAYWALAPETPGCPKLIHSVDDGRVKRVRGAIYAITDEHYPPPYASGFTNIVFEVKGYDEVGSFRLPKAAELTVNWLKGSAQTLSRIHRLTLTVGETKLLGSPIEFPPRLLGVAFVGDWRFALSNRPMQVSYVATNRFLSPEEVQTTAPGYGQALQTWQQIAAQGPLRMAETPKATWFWPAAGTLTAALVVGIWVMRKGHQQQNKQQQNKNR